MPKSFVTLAWVAAACAYLLIVLGAVVRISGSGMGCGDHWPLCNGHLFPPLNEIPTVIEWSHRLVAAVVSILVIGLVALDWRRAWPALILLIVQILLGAVTVKTGLTPAMVILHLATAMLLLAALIVTACGVPRACARGQPSCWLSLSLLCYSARLRRTWARWRRAAGFRCATGSSSRRLARSQRFTGRTGCSRTRWRVT